MSDQKLMVKPNTLRILHVLTDLSADQGYGGPSSNCVGHCLHFAGHQSSPITLFSTYVGESIDTTKKSNSALTFVLVKAYRLSKRKHKFVFQISFKSALRLAIEISKAETIHVHFGREMIPSLACLFASLLRKNLFIQTHGMVVDSDKFTHKLWDLMFTRIIFKTVRGIFYLTKSEKQSLLSLNAKPKSLIYLPNGITSFPLSQVRKAPIEPEVIFMARISERKRPIMFAEIAKTLQLTIPACKISMYGASERDELEKLKSYLKEKNVSYWYKGSVSNEVALKIIENASLLVLPSRNEPFPISVLESLVRGIPCLISEDCGLADIISKFDSDFVSYGHIGNWSQKAMSLINRYSDYDQRLALAKFANDTFNYDAISDVCIRAYSRKSSN
jgi:glycosyltransferase involved in cell wall biosynthesis